jgi:myo-inositol-1(or 4)-monophosphatase
MLATAVEVASEAAELARASRQDAIGVVDTKSTETDVVTAADMAVERLVRERLERLRPGEPVLGEEGGGEHSASGTSWVVDPIDGTVNYLYGYPWYSVSLAVQRDGVSVAGAVVEPATGRRWTAVRGAGAWCDGKALRVSGCRRLELAMLGTGFAYLPERRRAQARLVARMLPTVRDIRRSGCASLDLCAVAAGWLDAYAEHGLHRWDWAAGALIAEEAGAAVRLPGEEPALGADLTVAATPEIAAALRSLLAGAGSAEV